MTKGLWRAAAGGLVVAVALAGCSRDDDAGPAPVEPSEHSGPPTSVSAPAMPPLPAPFESVDQYDAGSVMHAAVVSMFGWRPGTDRTPRDAVVRTRPLLDDRYFAAADQSFVAMSPVTGAEWDEWTAAKATTRVTATETNDAHPPDQQTTRARIYDVSVDVLAGDGHKLDTKRFAVYAVATLLGVWRLSDLAVR